VHEPKRLKGAADIHSTVREGRFAYQTCHLRQFEPGKDGLAMTDERHGLPIIHRARVRPEWIDYNQHLNAGYYMVVFDDAVAGWLDYCSLTPEHRETHGSTTFSVESHATYEREVLEGDEVVITGQLLDFSDKKIHTFFRMYHADQGYLAATNELMTLHIDLTTRRPGPMQATVLACLETIRQAQAPLPRPPQAGRVISVHAGQPPGE
jgi:acyl-CoA thioester hydrolase